MNNKKEMSVVCSNCGAQLSVDGQQEIVKCRYCGSSFSTADLLDESDRVRIEKIKSQAYKDVEMGKMQVERERMSQAMETEKMRQEEARLNQFKKGKFSKVLLIFAAICMLSCVTAFSKMRIFPGMIALVQTVLFMMSWLMGMQIIKEKKKGVHILVAVIAFLLIIPFFRFNNTQKNTITTNAPMEMAEFEWPDSDIGKLLPMPKSNIGSISWERSDGFLIYVGKTTKEEYNAYVKECAQMGFNVDYSKGDNSYRAENEEGFALFLNYEGNDVMRISIKAPAKEEPEKADSEKETPQKEPDKPEEPEEPEEPEGAAENESIPESAKETDSEGESAPAESSNLPAGGIRREFKEALDSYEAFFDEYIAFMEKYANSDNAIGMLTDYLAYMERYAETMEKLDALDDSEMSTEEALYYMEVQTRITQKLAAAVQ